MYNAERYLGEAIDSVLRQTFKDFELIIIDDHSSDRSVSIAKSYPDERIRLMVNYVRTGLRKSLNVALKVARGKFITRQDADDVSLPRRFEKQVALLEKHLNVGLVGTGYFLIDERGKVLARHIFPENPRQALMKRNVFCHGSVMFRRAAIDRVGPYNESCKYSEDYELWLRLAKSYSVRNINEPLYAWRYHGSQRGGHALGFLKCEYAYDRIARIFLADRAQEMMTVWPKEQDALAMVNMVEMLGIYGSWICSKIARSLQRHKLGRVGLNIGRQLTRSLTHTSAQSEESYYFINPIPLISLFVVSTAPPTLNTMENNS